MREMSEKAGLPARPGGLQRHTGKKDKRQREHTSFTERSPRNTRVDESSLVLLGHLKTHGSQFKLDFFFTKTSIIQLLPRFQIPLSWVRWLRQGRTNGPWHYLSARMCEAARRALHSNGSLRRRFLRSKASLTTAS